MRPLRLILTTAGLLLGAAAPAWAQAPYSINGSDTVFVLFSAALVLLMTPGLAFFYAGMVKGKNVLNTIMLSFATMAIVSIQWIALGYSLSFAPGWSLAPGWFGTLPWLGLTGVGLEPNPAYSATIPHMAFMIFQMMFAIITPALISGSIVERVKFTSFVVFVLLWSTFVYDTVAHWVWATDGWLRALGALDFAGGTVVHVTAGVSGLVAAMVLGARRDHGAGAHQPHNIPFVVLGASLLWFGWFGFNAGSSLSINGIATLAFVTTHAAASAGTLTWMVIEWWKTRNVTVIGAVSGTISGLVAITPAAGFVSPLAALAIGAISAAACYTACHWKNRSSIDDSLDAFTLHGAGGIIGALLTGVFASKSLNPAGADGLLYGNPGLVVTQLVAVGAVAIFSAVGTFAILKLISLVKALRVHDDVEAEGLDLHQHRSVGYAFTGPLRNE